MVNAPRESNDSCAEFVRTCDAVIGKDFTLVNVGCLDGYEAHYTYEHSKYKVKAVCIDANPRVKKAFFPEVHDGTYPLNGIEYIEAAISNANDFRELHKTDAWGLTSLKREGGETARVMTYTLDFICGERGLLPDAMFIDVEGTVDDVLRSAKKSLKTVKVLCAEVETGQMDWVHKFLKPYGLIHDDKLGYSCESQGNYYWVKAPAADQSEPLKEN